MSVCPASSDFPFVVFLARRRCSARSPSDVIPYEAKEDRDLPAANMVFLRLSRFAIPSLFARGLLLLTVWHLRVTRFFTSVT